jgi:hypothetical protein
MINGFNKNGSFDVNCYAFYFLEQNAYKKNHHILLSFADENFKTHRNGNSCS